MRWHGRAGLNVYADNSNKPRPPKTITSPGPGAPS
jgi:hypothetical protein